MKNTIKSRYEELNSCERLYAKTIIPTFITFTIYMLIGIPVLMP